ncbi:hypothetical protein BOW53_11550 [Solemya pervernicosa gill symbiont]|uniref:diguanylate cyclase n=1 Tax=Solemya pervernicosa gill symbiont TaxID=642797 RepID=A0A1T2L2Y6_9GAMM|nr:diguanylate cyclase [Solemya pervernicosa gill symbiont]OOZ39441.1 hypothetical protein BOW53_11550 [Solemya pervernicosa gill symbiont]
MTDSQETPSVLLVDDQEMVAHLIRDMLSNDPEVAFHYCQEATSAIAMASEVGATTILLDLVMPDVDGMMLLKYFRANPATRDVPIIVLSSREQPETKRNAFQLGATDYLVKPPEQIELIARVRSHFRQYLDRKERDAALQELQSAQQELERMNEELKKLSLTDALTSVPNRRYFDESMEREFSRAQRDQHEISVIMIDIDNFKKYNDSYGHLEGDSCLQLVAKAMSDAVKRPTDTIARYGGEEFSILLPETPLEGAKEVAEVVRAAVEALGIEHKENPPGVVTVSLGVATVIPDNENINKPVSFVNLADKALYNAKETGRNRFVAAGD